MNYAFRLIIGRVFNCGQGTLNRFGKAYCRMAYVIWPYKLNRWPETGALQPPANLPLEMKAMHDEMGGVYDTQFGRMSGMLGLSNPLSPVHVLIPYGYASPPTDLAGARWKGLRSG
jgi:hypothetical protein